MKIDKTVTKVKKMVETEVDVETFTLELSAAEATLLYTLIGRVTTDKAREITGTTEVSTIHMFNRFDNAGVRLGKTQCFDVVSR